MSTLLDEIRETVTRIAGDVGGSVVGIGRRGPHGTGVVIGDGQVVTNAHNLRRDRAVVSFADGRVEEGDVVAADYELDLAIVAVDTGDAPTIELGDGAVSGIGEPVVALSNPGGRGLRVTMGFVSGTERSFRGPRGRMIKGSLEHTAPLLPGSSGGPVVDRAGRLLGINTNRLGEGFYLAIPAGNDFLKTLERLSEGRVSDRVRLGVGVAPTEVARKMRRAVGLEPMDGLLVRKVEDGSPAAEAGIAKGDLLVSIGETTLESADDLHSALRDIEPGSEVTASVVRGVEELAIEITFPA